MLQVMIVDDSLIMRKQIRQIIEDLGHKVVGEARNSADALYMHARFRIDLVTMDITMPGNDGIFTTKSIMEGKTPSKIVMVTSHGQEEMVVDAIKAGAVSYILKPVTPEKISEMINTIF